MREPRVRPIDFTRPTKFAADQQRRIENAHEAFCRRTTTRFSIDLRTSCEIRLVDSAQLTWAGALERVSLTSIYAQGVVVGSGERLMLVMDIATIMAIIERQLGGSGVSPYQTEGREMTLIEQQIAKRTLSFLYEQLSLTWEEIGGLRFALDEIHVREANIYTAVALNEPTLILTMEMQIDSQVWPFQILFPYSAISSISERLAHGRYTPEDIALQERRVQQALETVDLELSVELTTLQMPLDELAALSAGDEIPLGQIDTGQMRLLVGERPLYRVRAGRAHGKRIVQVLDPLNGRSASNV